MYELNTLLIGILTMFAMFFIWLCIISIRLSLTCKRFSQFIEVYEREEKECTMSREEYTYKIIGLPPFPITKKELSETNPTEYSTL